MKLTREVNKENFYKEYYTTLNGILKLSKLELEILSQLSWYKYKELPILDKAIRKEIAAKLGITTFNLNNYIGILKDKKMLVNNDNSYDINPSIYKDLAQKEHKIEFTIYVK